MEIIHLNGVVTDPLHSLTFSETQYAERVARQEPLYARCVADLTARPVVFIGTELREIALWQHMELRREHLGGGRDMRPASILVCPSLNPAREVILHEYKIEWVNGTAESFATDVLAGFTDVASKGFDILGDPDRRGPYGQVPLVGDIAPKRPNLSTEYLLGEEPHWSDLFQGRAVERNHDKELGTLAMGILNGHTSNTTIGVSGTAGTGKSTALMRLGLSLSDFGIPVLWVDKNSDASPFTIRQAVRRYTGRVALLIDDADLYGSQLPSMIQDLVPCRSKFLFVFAVRSSRLSRVADYLSLHATGIRLQVHIVPPLTDTDIDMLIEVLGRHNRLGILTGLSHQQRREAFEREAGRQLLVAMIQATSGYRFEEKVGDELETLSGITRRLYALVCVASALRSFLYKDEILLAIGRDPDNVLYRLDRLVAEHLITANPPQYRYRARHRVIADLVQDRLKEMGELRDVLVSLARAIGSKLNPNDKHSRLRRFITYIINHDVLLNLIEVMDARSFYDELENLLNYDYHYWLQRGSLEVERGDIRRAERYLSTARSIAPEREYRVDTAYAYMLMKKATEDPTQTSAAHYLGEGIKELKEVIRTNGKKTPYPYHVLGSQGLAWTRRAQLSGMEKRIFIRELVEFVGDGIRWHPWERSLTSLKQELRRDELLTVTRTGSNR